MVVTHVLWYSEQKSEAGDDGGATHTPPPLADACGQWMFGDVVVATPRWYSRHA